jgi:hypothetical protein
MEIKYNKPDFFHPKQSEIYDCEKKYTVVISSNKTGKTLALACWLNERSILGIVGKRAWLAPYAKTAKIGYDLMVKIIKATSIYKHLKDSNHPNQFKFNSSSPQKITYPNGAVIDFVQGNNVDAIFGEAYEDAVVDEATRLKQEVVSSGDRQTIICPAFKALQTTMIVTQGQIKIISNPTTKNNFFYKWYLNIKEGKDERAAAFHMNALDSIKAGFVEQEDFDYAKEHESAHIFKRDWLGEVPDEESQVFMPEKVYACVDDDITENIAKVAFFGVDLGFTTSNSSDYTVVTGMNARGQVVFFKRFKAEGETLINKLKAYINNRPAYIDATAGGGHTVYMLLASHCPKLEPYKFSNTTKCDAIETLAHYIHTNAITYKNNDIIINELLGYECEINDKGLAIYNNGKSIQNDDAVISLSLAVMKYKESTDLGDAPTGELFEIDNGYDEEPGWQSVNDYTFDYGIY